MNSPGMSKSPQVPSLLRRIGLSFLLGFGLFVLGANLQGALDRRGISGVNVYVDDMVLGALAGLMVFAYEQRRSREIRKKLAMISAMNHHVRNALQTISFLPYADQARQILLVQQSVNRIQWALRAVLEGDSAAEQGVPPASAAAPLQELEKERKIGAS